MAGLPSLVESNGICLEFGLQYFICPTESNQCECGLSHRVTVDFMQLARLSVVGLIVAQAQGDRLPLRDWLCSRPYRPITGTDLAEK